MTQPLTRGTRKPVRLVHLGLGSFFRAHQARFTHLCVDAADWGYAAFTVRSPVQSDLLESQDGMYTLTETSAHGETTAVVDQVCSAHSGDDVEALCRYVADPAVAVVTLTITEGGYGAADRPDAIDVREDAVRVRDAAGPAPRSPLARLVVALDARRRAGAGAIAVMSCDNLPDNGDVTRRAVAAYASDVPETAAWIERNVAFCSTTVDRITPRITDDDRTRLAERTGFDDAAPVITEQYAEWIVEGEFPAGRPSWESAGVLFTDEVRPYEMRKLRMLNGAHTLLAVAGLRRGLATVDEAIADAELAAAAEDWWDAAGATLPEHLDADAYSDALRTRFANPALRHDLTQIAENTVVKLRTRVVPVLDDLAAAKRPARGALRILAEWSLAVAEGILPDGDTGDTGDTGQRIRALVPDARTEDIEAAVDAAQIPAAAPAPGAR